MNQPLIPLWEELPSLDLYLDQVLLYINQINQQVFSLRDKPLTAAMINNYVKHGYLQKPLKKKYSRTQLARLLALTTLKTVFPITDIAETIELLLQTRPSQELYDEFARCINQQAIHTTHPAIQSACETVQLFHQTRRISLHLKGGTHETSSQT
ncbi:DUF1836 domain-containing protein [Streptococcus himalayensis]|uniref:DUF1836 domain-containing protein n=1 Tax=Streptococcus himalayensis TaxID=1888195 RepID=A0A917A6R7_9STRE|nr:DUF1836 domain-containing protein [Streptococcus himalayensis]GGE31687.1 hypothetical protein GCM10011510_11260 [Streptococcus himalayensis]